MIISPFQSLNKGALFRAVERVNRFIPSPRGVHPQEDLHVKKLYLVNSSL
jgi:hypothetical protein